MNKEILIRKVLGLIAGLIVLSVIFMLLVMPGIYSETIPDHKNIGAVVAIAIAAVLRLVLFFWTIKISKKISTDGLTRKMNDYFLVIAISLFLLGLVYTDGAVAFSNDEPKYISTFMFTSVFCEIFAAVLCLVAILMNRKRGNQ